MTKRPRCDPSPLTPKKRVFIFAVFRNACPSNGGVRECGLCCDTQGTERLADTASDRTDECTSGLAKGIREHVFGVTFTLIRCHAEVPQSQWLHGFIFGSHSRIPNEREWGSTSGECDRIPCAANRKKAEGCHRRLRSLTKGSKRELEPNRIPQRKTSLKKHHPRGQEASVFHFRFGFHSKPGSRKNVWKNGAMFHPNSLPETHENTGLPGVSGHVEKTPKRVEK